ncbi:hypothetical protein GCM10025865_23840 [Paraoerskovia sediminicola]|uniref:Copper(I)-binding protein n=1 Tax=Paraoerskovia sediminicola TaxID=1138587 RepID=A0ABN6XE83_9CELL|nr:copper chaperone PCu(A)C [Paraoerskovia sediminicola]BDZ43085.1 hypothetical protein GCM10025865_23840 [Paraoerskovia sediminicola]
MSNTRTITRTSTRTDSLDHRPSADPSSATVPSETSGRAPRAPRSLLVGVAAASLTLVLAGCASDDGAAASPPASTGSSSSAGSTESDGSAEADALTMTDPWVKAVDEGMTAAFGTLENSSDADLVVVSATTTAGSTAELHEMAEGDDGAMTMQEKEGGFVVPAGGEHVLEPGGDHVMVMGVTDPILAGDPIEVTLTLEDGSTLDVEAPARTYSGANESYDEHGDDGHDHS